MYKEELYPVVSGFGDKTMKLEILAGFDEMTEIEVFIVINYQNTIEIKRHIYCVINQYLIK